MPTWLQILIKILEAILPVIGGGFAPSSSAPQAEQDAHAAAVQKCHAALAELKK